MFRVVQGLNRPSWRHRVGILGEAEQNLFFFFSVALMTALSPGPSPTFPFQLPPSSVQDRQAFLHAVSECAKK